MSVPAFTLQQLLWRTLKSTRGETVTYYVGSISVELTAVVTKPNEGQLELSDSISLESKSWDVLIDPDWPADAPAIFVGLVPKQGHKIVRSDGTEFFVQPSASSTCWRWSDALHTWRRLHVEAK